MSVNKELLNGLIEYLLYVDSKAQLYLWKMQMGLCRSIIRKYSAKIEEFQYIVEKLVDNKIAVIINYPSQNLKDEDFVLQFINALPGDLYGKCYTIEQLPKYSRAGEHY